MTAVTTSVSRSFPRPEVSFAAGLGASGGMTHLVFFYGTLMSPFQRPARTSLDHSLRSIGRGSIPAALYDLGLYAAAVPDEDSRVWGEVYEMVDAEAVLSALDEFEGYRVTEPDASLYMRAEMTVTFDDGRGAPAWVYLYNAPLGKAPRIESGDYLRHFTAR
jgi:gamma-glutamylcyclotransferase (GGCT)/AIG2-like uncharacterized protein YtfP